MTAVRTYTLDPTVQQRSPALDDKQDPVKLLCDFLWEPEPGG